MILAGDIGGTKTVLAIFDQSADGLREVGSATFPSRAHATFDEVLARFLETQPRQPLVAAVFGVAGAVIEGKCHTTNLPWQLDEQELASTLGVPRVKLLNDLEAAAYGMLFLRPDELCILNHGPSPRRKGNIAVIAAGTGLGEGMLFWDSNRFHPLASEAGHCDFAPRTELEIGLLRYLSAKFLGHVSYERVLSGDGFSNVYGFLRDTGYAPESPEVAQQIAGENANAVIAQFGLAGKDKLCATTLELICAIYGAEAGNLALKCVAVGGVFVGGGIAPKILPALQSGAFMHGFLYKGRFSELMQSIEVSVALNPRAPLLGAAHFALELES